MTKQSDNIQKENNPPKPKCGIVMPISPIDGCPAEHWLEVLSILKESIELAGFEPNLVSDADDSGIIQKRIIQNLYSNEMIVCDVSAKNPNVMFELGMRLAFDKPTIIIKDDKTDYSFDTSVIEHLGYPRDLRFTKILTFKDALKKKIQNTYEKSIKDPNYTTFLKHFGEYKIAEISNKEVSSDKFILKSLEEFRNDLAVIKRNQNLYLHVNESRPISVFSHYDLRDDKTLQLEDLVSKRMDKFKKLRKIDTISTLDKELIEEFIQYLEKSEEIKKTFEREHPDTLRQIIEGMLPPF